MLVPWSVRPLEDIKHLLIFKRFKKFDKEQRPSDYQHNSRFNLVKW